MDHYPISSLLNEKAIPFDAPINVDAIASRYGIKVISTPLQGKVGEITFNSDGSSVIKMDPFENSYEPRRRFTLAHELGHFFLHRVPNYAYEDTKETMLDRKNTYWDGKEGEANSFAAQLLMPEKLIERYGTQIISADNNISLDDFVNRMSTIFNVSKQSMRFRLSGLGIIKI